ncbi:Stk1 family PASTA domain-containing Ser/Thr kinase [Cellulomonas alba]|uniref:non-specific serine/threonine protein kinase n=1 Tax=Cellulomonas alba TaxID=3053467 RepID=A0ABT7SBN2_9CELL|nr:Stk1 family PASTA domain-containing Ser/Thr kinase [Cellulomonas alba]MDM7853593.1 Stk1 family PASTA domain-containing Ser/Thr kinase [Cellulomonas alba]
MGATVTDPLVGRLVDGRYEVLSRIARGGMATVYLAVDRRLDREVALKVMHPHLAEGTSGADFVARFRREARTAARLTHPGLVGVYDQGVDGDTSYLTMEYVDGVTLRRRLGERGALSVGEALRIADAVLDALAAAHRGGLVHRDIKPENVLLANDDRVKLADFGLARAVTEVTATTTGTVLGTVAYLAPELVVRGVSDARTDVYACGVLLFEMLTGKQPFTGDTPIQVAFQHVNNDVPAPSDQVDWLPIEVDELVRALAARDPDDRPVDAAAAAALLRRTRAELDPETLARAADVPPTIVLPAATDPDETELDTGSASTDETTWIEPVDHHGSTVALPIGLASASAPAATAPAAGRVAAPRRRHRLLAALLVLVLLLGGGAWWYVAAGPAAHATVPPLAGLSQQAATRALAARGLHAHAVQAYDDASVGTVFSSQPRSGAQVHKGSDVTISVSQGPRLTTMPKKLIGVMQNQAAATLQAAHLGVSYGEQQYDDAAPRGAVLHATLPDGSAAIGGDRVPWGTTVQLVISDGPAPVTIPSVLGGSQADAKETLSGSGLKLAVKKAYSDTVPAGQVMAQSPKPDAEGHRGETVTVTVSQGPELVDLPNVYGENVANATKRLQEAGFKVEVHQPQGITPLNIVYSQHPGGGGGKQAPKGSTVVINVF